MTGEADGKNQGVNSRDSVVQVYCNVFLSRLRSADSTLGYLSVHTVADTGVHV